MRDLHAGRFILLRFDEVILRDAHVLGSLDCGEVIRAVLLDGNLGGEKIAGLRFQVDLGAVIQLDDPVLQRTIGFDFQLRHRLDHGTQIATRILDVVPLSEPRRVMIRNFDVLHASQLKP